MTIGVFFYAKGNPEQAVHTEIKVKVVEAMQKEKMSHKEAERQFELPDGRAAAWERIYLMEGPEGFSIERRGRGSKGRPTELPKRAEEDLLTEVQRLRAENAYLKNLQALVLENEQHERKKRR